MEENANKLHFSQLKLCYAFTDIDIFGVQNSESFHIGLLIANIIFIFLRNIVQ